MAFDPEDGTGKATATSLCSVAMADTFWADHGALAAWTAATTSDKEAALNWASDYIRNQVRYRWSGTKKTYAQTMPWPRTGAAELDGQSVPDNVVPWAVTAAAAYLAGSALADGAALQPALPNGGRVVTQESVDVLSVSYDTAKPGSRADTVIQYVDGLLASLLRTPLLSSEPAYYEPTTPDAFTDDRFTNMT